MLKRSECVERLEAHEPVVRLELTPKQKGVLELLIRDAGFHELADPQNQLLTTCRTARSFVAEVLSRHQRRTCELFTSTAKHTALVIGNLPVGQLGRTPSDGFRPKDKDSVSEVVALGLMSLLGYPIGYFNERGGEIVQQVVPVEEVKAKNTGLSRASFGFHADNAFLRAKYRQELIGLLCLTNPSGAGTLLLALATLIREMSDRLWEWAFEANVRFAAPASFDLGGAIVYTEPRPMLYLGTEGLPRFQGNTYSVKGLTPKDDEMIAEFVALANSVEHHRVVLTPGEFLVFHDDAAMHGREPFEGDRWLQRLYGRFSLEDLWGVTGDRAARVFDVRQFFFNN